jgi:signal transduction histidine kinase
MWLRSHPTATIADLESLIRFDEAIDRALTKSVAEFMDRLDKSRGIFLGILGHDLRDPLATIITGSKLLLEGGLDESMSRDVTQRIVNTGERMHHLVGDLLDATRTRRDGQMPITRREADLGDAVRHVADEFATSHPDRAVTLSVAGDPRGQWDDRRVSQAVANLVTNALRFGRADKPIDIAIAADDEVTIAVHNEGPAVPEERRVSLFEPLSGADVRDGDGRDAQHLGLGLYIARAIVRAHGGRIEVDSSSERGTTFTIHLPRGPSTRNG